METTKKTTSFWGNPKNRAFIYQAVTILIVLYGLYWIIDNTRTNMLQRGLASGFGFLDNTAGFGIIQSIIPYSEESSYLTTFFVSLINTLIIAVVGCIMATFLGFLIGVGRLSKNWVIRKLSSIYVETFRNIPLLLQILFWYNAVLKPLASPRDVFEKGQLVNVGLTNRGFTFAEPTPEPGFGLVLWCVLFGIIASIAIKKWSTKRQMSTGQTFPVGLTSLGLIIVLPYILYLILGSPMHFEPAQMGSFSLQGGISIIPEFMALLLSLVVYTAAFIAEIVRAGIMAVSHGQTEAAHALGIRPSRTLKLVIIPQALRVIIPPLTSQYLNLTKNSSLATAIAYPDLVSVFAGTVLNQTGQAVEIMGMTLAVYLTLSLLTSGFMNWYNNRIKLVER